ncbi:MAG TPA: protein-glutamate O-methyltransferase CheR [Firmicutes bacterium]|nr:protein-glutamate O-methyltransferase CheR [Bacillota bacterium]
MEIDREFESFKQSIRQLINLDLNCYKEKQLKRRIQQFIQRSRARDYREFLDLLAKDAALLKRFRDYLTINTSEFFRDTKVFEHLSRVIIPALRKETSFLKIWSAGCSIGAEPYSLAILLAEQNIRNFKIDASDYDPNALKKGREGTYPLNLLKNLSPGLLEKYFTPADGLYTVKDFLKKNITWKEHNLLQDSFPHGYDLILCRNVFIYFTQQAQAEVLAKFSRSLRTNGYLVIGSSEFIYYPENYNFVKESFSIYKKISE